MRKELYKDICKVLGALYSIPGDGIYQLKEGDTAPENAERVVKHIDLWNQNVEFIEEEMAWERPAVFVEFNPIRWREVMQGVEYRAETSINLHIVSDWGGGTYDGCELKEESLNVFDLSDQIHAALCGLTGERFADFDIIETKTNHNHEEIVEHIDVYKFVAIKRLD